MRDFTSYRFLWPPRPERAIYKDQLSLFEKRRNWAQAKKNGTCSVLAISPDRKVTAMQRTNKPHIMWSPSPHTAETFRGLPGGWYVFVAELLHSKIANAAAIGLRDINYINDILVADSQTLSGTTFAERQAMLASLFNAKRLPVAHSGSHYVIDNHTWLARNHTRDFRNLFDNLSSPEDEGLVLKQPTATLAPCLRANSNVLWQLKVRKSTKNYAT